MSIGKIYSCISNWSSISPKLLTEGQHGSVGGQLKQVAVGGPMSALFELSQVIASASPRQLPRASRIVPTRSPSHPLNITAPTSLLTSTTAELSAPYRQPPYRPPEL